MGKAEIHSLDGGCQSGKTIADDQQQTIPHQAASIQILQQSFPGGLTFCLAAIILPLFGIAAAQIAPVLAAENTSYAFAMRKRMLPETLHHQKASS